MRKFVLTSLDEEEFRQLIVSCMNEVVGIQKSYTTNPSQSTLLTVEQAAQYLNLARQTLYGYTSQRVIPFIKKGKKLYFEKEALDQWLLEGKKQTRAEIEAGIGINQKGGKYGR